jgi:hypothetical protein
VPPRGLRVAGGFSEALSGAAGNGARGSERPGLRAWPGATDLAGFGRRLRARVGSRSTCSVPAGPSGRKGKEQVVWSHRSFGFGGVGWEHAGRKRGLRASRAKGGVDWSDGVFGLRSEGRLVQWERSFGSGRTGLRPPCFLLGASAPSGERVESFEPRRGLRVAAQASGMSEPRGAFGLRSGAGRDRTDGVFGHSDGRSPKWFAGVFGLRRSATARLPHRAGFGSNGGLGGSARREGVSALERRARPTGGSTRTSVRRRAARRRDGFGKGPTPRGDRHRERCTATRQEQSSEGCNPMSGSGMKQGRQARGG